MATNISKRLSFKTKVGYGVGQLGSGLGYNLYYYYFIYFMTSLAGVNPAIAGTISLFAVIWDAVTDPMVGVFSDGQKIRTGTRRNLMMKASIPLGITVFLLFTSFNFPNDSIKVIYYLIINILFWLSFTCCDIPHITIGQELTDDFDEKSKIRGFSTAFLYVGELVVSGATIIIVERSVSEAAGWSTVAIITAIVCAAAYFIAGLAVKGKERIVTPKEASANTNPLKNFRKCFKNKTYLILLAIVIFANCIVGIQASCNIYVQKFVYNLDAVSIGVINMGKCFYMILCSLAIGALSGKIDKRSMMIGGFLAYGFGMSVVKFGPVMLPVYIFALCFSALGNATFWTLIYSVLADVITIDNRESGENTSGTQTSLLSMFIKFGTSFGMWAVGLGLAAYGLVETAVTQDPGVVAGIQNIYGVGGGVLGLIIAFLAYKYPLSRKEYNRRIAELDAAGK